MILGLSTLMKFPEKTPIVLSRFSDLFKTLIKIVKKNAEDRINDEVVKK
jgi:hypothetical protein